jgi:uncharacterized protein YbaA (DUF1428 family)
VSALIKRVAKQFKEAEKKMAQAEALVAKVFGPRLMTACAAKDVNALQLMLEEMPENSRHKRRIYQAIIELERELTATHKSLGSRP